LEPAIVNGVRSGGHPLSMNTEVIESLIAQNKSLEPHREKLEAMQPGSYCIHRSWGFGQIREYNEIDGKIVIDFEDGKQGHGMDPAFCIEKLEVLPAGHILSQHRQDRKEVENRLKKDPVSVIVSILEIQPEKSATAFEIEQVLQNLFADEKKRKKWWTDTRKLLVKFPRVAVPVKKTEPYVLREDEITPEDEILEGFFETKQSKQKIVLAEKLFALSQDKTELKKDLEDVLKALTQAIQDTKMLSQGDRLYGVWVRNDLARDDSTTTDVETLQPTSQSIIEESADNLDKLARDLPAAYYKRFLDLLTRVYPDKWEELVVRLLRHSDGRFTGDCISFLYDRDRAGKVAECFERWLNEQTMRASILLWILKNRRSQKYAELIERLMNPRLLNAVFYAIDLESLQNAGARRIPLADALSDDAELIPELIRKGSQENARDLAQTLLLNQGFDDLSKKSLLVRFIRVYPSIQSLLEREATEEIESSGGLTVSKESYNRAQQEYRELINKKLPENRKAIEAAKEHGDLKENSEYKMARQDNDVLMARKAELERDLAAARVTDFTDAAPEQVSIGSVVELQSSGSSESNRFAILGAWDSDPDRSILSYLSPMGQQLLGKKLGETVTVETDGGPEVSTITRIGRWLDEKWV